jgi:hypothetical protein
VWFLPSFWNKFSVERYHVLYMRLSQRTHQTVSARQVIIKVDLQIVRKSWECNCYGTSSATNQSYCCHFAKPGLAWQRDLCIHKACSLMKKAARTIPYIMLFDDSTTSLTARNLCLTACSLRSNHHWYYCCTTLHETQTQRSVLTYSSGRYHMESQRITASSLKHSSERL